MIQIKDLYNTCIRNIVKNAEIIAYNKAIDDVYKLIDEHEEEVYIGVVDDILKLKKKFSKSDNESVGIILGGKKLIIDLNNLRDPERAFKNANGIVEDGEHYFDFYAAQEAANAVNKRLMTHAEHYLLCKCQNWWDSLRNGQVFRIPDWSGGLVDVFFPAAGYRNRGNGSLLNAGTGGYYWSSSPNDMLVHILNFYSISLDSAHKGYRQAGLSVRCVIG